MYILCMCLNIFNYVSRPFYDYFTHIRRTHLEDGRKGDSLVHTGHSNGLIELMKSATLLQKYAHAIYRAFLKFKKNQ